MSSLGHVAASRHEPVIRRLRFEILDQADNSLFGISGRRGSPLEYWTVLT